MIGHYLLTLTPRQEYRVLTQPFERVLESRGAVRNEDSGCRCLVLTATNGAECFGPTRGDGYAPGYAYEDLCLRFGEARINAAIRTRILANQARRMLGSARRALLERSK